MIGLNCGKTTIMQRDQWHLNCAKIVILLMCALGILGPENAHAQSPKTGKSAADKYFKSRAKNNRKSSSAANRKPANSTDRYLALHFGFYVDEETYKWGEQNQDEVGDFSAGVTYRIGEWVNSMDLALRADFQSFDIDDKRPFKMSVMPLVTFPDAASGFPLYFGAGLGAGIFFKQAEEESSLSLDYQIIAGTRFFNLVESMGFGFEFGIKNHVHVLSDGQHNGVFGSLGLIFTF